MDIKTQYEREISDLRRELDDAYAALKAFRKTSDETLQKEISTLEDIISQRLGPLPIPPEALRLHVGAKPFVSNFLNQGWASSRKVLKIFGESPSEPILDWGCGCGRTLRWLLKYPAWAENYRGTDVDREAIAWLNSHAIHSVTECDGQSIALPYASGELGGVFSFSVLTHIHPARFRDWMREIARILRPGGRAYLTFNGDSILESTHPNHAEPATHFNDKGWAWIEQRGHYKSAAFASHAFVREAALGLLKIQHILRRDYAAMDAVYAEAE